MVPLTIMRRVSWCFPRRPVGAEQRTPISVCACSGSRPAPDFLAAYREQRAPGLGPEVIL